MSGSNRLDQAIECPKCGVRNEGGPDFCNSCSHYLGYDGRKLDPLPGGMTVSVAPPSLPVEPGQEGTCEVRVTNRSNVVDQFSLSVSGEPSAWTLVDPQILSLFPNAAGVSTVRFHPPRSPQVSAGRTPFTVRVQSKSAPDGTTLQDGFLEIGAFEDVSAKIVPHTSHGSACADHRILIENRGNSQVRVALEASDPDELLSFTFDQPVQVIPPGKTVLVQLQVRPRNPLLQGPPQPRPFQVQVEPEAGSAVMAEGQMLQEPSPPPVPVRRRGLHLPPLLPLLVPLLAVLVVAVGSATWLLTRGTPQPVPSLSSGPTTTFANGIRGISGYYAADGYQHAVVATGDGKLNEVFWKAPDSTSPRGQDVLDTFSGIVGVAGYYAAGDRYQHVIVATADGNVWEFYDNPSDPSLQPGKDMLTAVTDGSIIGIAAYYADGDGYQHVIVATSSGSLWHYYFKPKDPNAPPGKELLTSFPGGSIVGVAGYYAADDGHQHVIVSTNDGAVQDFSWKSKGSSIDGSRKLMARFQQVLGIAGYYAAEVGHQNVVVATSDGKIHLIWWHPGAPGATSQDQVLTTLKGIVRIAAWYSGNDGYQRLLLTTEDAELHSFSFKQ